METKTEAKFETETEANILTSRLAETETWPSNWSWDKNNSGIETEPELSVGPISSTQPNLPNDRPNPTNCKVKTSDLQTNPTHNPIELRTTNDEPLGTKKTT